MGDLIGEIIDVREKSRLLIDTADEAVSLVSGDNVKIMLPNAYDELPDNRPHPLKIIAIGRRSYRKYPIFGAKVQETLFFRRFDRVWTRHHQQELVGQYASSGLGEYSKKELISTLDQTGEWGLFLKLNEGLLDLIHTACVGGFLRPVTKIKFEERTQ